VIYTGKALTYEEAREKIRNKKCEPLFIKDEWFGSRKNKKILKYWFRDENGHNFYSAYDNVANGSKSCCNDCSIESQKENQKLTIQQYIDYCNEFKLSKNINVLSLYEDYRNIKQKLECKCLICNKPFKESIQNLIKKDSHGCLNMPKGEMITMSRFEEYGIEYDYQVYISELNLTSDFEIKLKNKTLIHLEIDGDQHFDFPNQFHKTYEDFINAQERDIQKDKWYSDKQYINIHIRFNVGGKNNDDIELILKDIINGRYGECENKPINLFFDILSVARNSNKNKKVIAYTLDGNFHSIHENILNAQSELNVDNSCISQCLNGKRNCKQAGGYIFKLYTKNFPLHVDSYQRKLSKIVLVYKNGCIIDEVESLNEVGRKYNIHNSSLSRYLNNKGNNPSKDNYDFKYKEIS